MIKDNTVFILGAGASKPFGLPLGSELVDLIYNSLEYRPASIIENIGSISGSKPREVFLSDDTKSSNPLFQMLLNMGHKKDDILRFREDLKESQLNSVDAFLEHRVEYIPIGKAAIAYNLLRFESEKNLYKNPDWYKYLRNLLNSTIETFKENHVSFITFNYDRSLEYYLINTIKATYGKSIEESFELLSCIPIIHLHGKLGPLPWEAEDKNIPFGHLPSNDHELKYVADSIKIIHEKIDEDEEFKAAKKILNDAKKIFILGFGFSETNISRLGLNEIEIKSICSSYGMTPLEIDRINKSNSKILLTSRTELDCYNFLRNIAKIT